MNDMRICYYFALRCLHWLWPFYIYIYIYIYIWLKCDWFFSRRADWTLRSLSRPFSPPLSPSVISLMRSTSELIFTPRGTFRSETTPQGTGIMIYIHQEEKKNIDGASSSWCFFFSFFLVSYPRFLSLFSRFLFLVGYDDTIYSAHS